eukprot:8976048-Pyramimonas_sp.AAC.1
MQVSSVLRARVWPARGPREAAHQRSLLSRVTPACGRRYRRRLRRITAAPCLFGSAYVAER